jgi:uncharacterized protein (TIGR03437 family)
MNLYRLLYTALFLLVTPFAFAQCPPVNFVQGSTLKAYGGGEAIDFVREPNGSLSRHTFGWTSGVGFGLGAKSESLANFEHTFGNCAGTSRTFQLTSGWRMLAERLGTSSRNPIAGDLVGDGSVAGIGSATSNGNKAYIAIANADGTLRSQTTIDISVNAVGYLIADLNADQKKDLVVAKFGNGGSDKGGVIVYLGNGNGTFQPPVAYPAGEGVQSVTAFDFNADGKIDLAAGSYFTNDVAILIGNGNGGFAAPVKYAIGESVFSVAVGDFNRDGTADLVVGSYNNGVQVPTGGVWILIGNSGGTFQAARNVMTNVVARGVATGDFNKDAKPDVVVIDWANHTASVMLGDGAGAFPTVNRYQSTAGTPFAVDLDGDGNLDVVVGAGHPDALTANAGIRGAGAEEDITVLFGKGDGTLLGAATAAVGKTPTGIGAGDFNGDGKMDFAVVSNVSKEIWVFLGKGSGLFQAPTLVTIAGATPLAVAAGDVNGDGRADLMVTDTAVSKIHVLFGNANGTFGAPGSYAVGGNPGSVVAVDLNGDQKLDLAVASSAAPAGVNVLLNNGSGVFGAAQTLAAGVAPMAIAAADFNKDGKPDLVAVDAGTGIQVLLGNGNGTFQAAVQFAGLGSNPSLIATGDLNGDGSPDVVIAGPKVNGVPFVDVLLGNGNGTFGTASLTELNFNPTAIVVVDLSGDGKADVAIAECCGEVSIELLVGNGIGAFQTRTETRGGSSHSALAAADLNGDQKADLMVGDIGFSNNAYATVLLNAATSVAPNVLYTVNAASFLQGAVAPDSIVTLAGTGLASGAAAVGLGAAMPYPAILGGTTIKILDSTAVERVASIYFVSSRQVNYILPAATALGAATVTATAADGTVSSGPMTVSATGPGLFLFSGTDIAAANAVRVRDGAVTIEDVFSIPGGIIVAKPINLGPAGDIVALVLYGTGIRGRTSLANVSLTIGGVSVPVDYAGAQPQFTALDQVNFTIPRSLAGRGDVAIVLTVDGKPANTAHVTIQ